MPPQLLAQFDERSRRGPSLPWDLRSHRRRRALVLGGSAILAGLATHEMWLALAVGQHLTVIQILVLVLVRAAGLPASAETVSDTS